MQLDVRMLYHPNMVGEIAGKAGNLYLPACRDCKLSVIWMHISVMLWYWGAQV